MTPTPPPPDPLWGFGPARRPHPGWRPPPRTPLRGHVVRLARRIEKIAVLCLGLGAVGGVVWLFVYAARHNPRARPLRLTQAERLLVVAPHPDDEMVLAGGLMLMNLKLGGVTRVVYLTDGDAYLSGKWGDLYAIRRRREARSALKALGVPRDSQRFFGLNDSFDTLTPQKTLWLKNRLKKEVADFAPSLVIAPAYEGGHCLHDVSSALTAHAVAETHQPTRLWEGTEYNPYFGIETPRKTLAPVANLLLKLLPGKLLLRPEPVFIPRGAGAEQKRVPVYRTHLTYAERRKKLTALRKYASQNLQQRLTRRFGRAEWLRPYPGYDYAKPPFEHARSLNYRLCDRWLGGTALGQWALAQYGTPAWAGLPGAWGGISAPHPARSCLEYSVCHITHDQFLQKLPESWRRGRFLPARSE